MTIQRLSLNVHTLYQQLLEQVVDDALSQNIGNLLGTFVTKQIKGHTYFYLQYREAGKQKQIYLGPDSLALQKALSTWKVERTKADATAVERRNLCAMLRQGGASSLDPQTGKILSLLTHAGLFRMGAILVGTHAFQAYTNVLGIRWNQGAIRTQDLDLAQDPGIALSVSPDIGTDLPQLLERANMGFIPIPSLNHHHPSTSFKVARREIKLDLLSPLLGRESSTPIPLPALKTYATPLRFLDYLISDPLQVVLINGDGLLVNIPQPARFAWHKLIISTRRPISEHAKQKKDLVQARQLLEVLLEDRPGDLQISWNDLVLRGEKWVKHAKQGLHQLGDPKLIKQLSDIF